MVTVLWYETGSWFETKSNTKLIQSAHVMTMCSGSRDIRCRADLVKRHLAPQMHDDDLPLLSIEFLQRLRDQDRVELAIDQRHFAAEPSPCFAALLAPLSPLIAAIPLQQPISCHPHQPREGVVRRRRFGRERNERLLDRIFGGFTDAASDQHQPIGMFIENIAKLD